MAATATDVVTLDEVKSYLGLSSATEHDVMLERQIQAACEFVSEHLGRYVLDVPIEESISITSLKDPVLTKQIDIKAGSVSLLTWTNPANVTIEPDLEITDLGRITERALGTYIYPKSEWKKTGQYFIRMTVGLKEDKIPSAIKESIVLVVRQLYDGYKTITDKDAIFILLAPFRRPIW